MNRRDFLEKLGQAAGIAAIGGIANWKEYQWNSINPNTVNQIDYQIDYLLLEEAVAIESDFLTIDELFDDEPVGSGNDYLHIGGSITKVGSS